MFLPESLAGYGLFHAPLQPASHAAEDNAANSNRPFISAKCNGIGDRSCSYCWHTSASTLSLMPAASREIDMALLQNKNILVTGLLSSRSIAYGIAKAMTREGARLAFSYQGERVKDRVVELAAEFDSKLVLPCDVASDQEIDALFESLKMHWDGLDGIVHSIAFAPREALAGDYLDSVSREAFRIAHEVSSYS